LARWRFFVVLWSVASVLGSFSALVIALNWLGALSEARSQRSYSPIPFVGGILGCSALLMLPVVGARWFAWLPLLLDYSIPGFLYAVFVLGAFRK
jgi:hypothetical protein